MTSTENQANLGLEVRLRSRKIPRPKGEYLTEDRVIPKSDKMRGRRIIRKFKHDIIPVIIGDIIKMSCKMLGKMTLIMFGNYTC